MLKKTVVTLAITAGAVSTGMYWLGNPSHAEPQKQLASNSEAREPREPRQDDPLKATAKLPITQVVMFNSGVGYFQRSGPVDGDARVELLFPASGINDMIKTLVISDSKGKITPLRYDSQEPIEKTLKSFGIDLSGNPSYGQLINQIRGEKVEVTMGNNAGNLPATMQGTIMGMESQMRGEPGKPATEKEFLNLLCSEGLRNIPLADIQRVRFLNPVLESELKRALEVVSIGHDSQKKTVRLGFRGEGKRDVKVSYVAEHPIWKTSYRIRLDKNGKAKMESWATVDNTSDEDWQDVKLVLVSSRPISYQMDMYAPLNIPRPIVEPELFASLRPPTYGGPIASGGNGIFTQPLTNPIYANNSIPLQNGGIGGGINGGFQGPGNLGGQGGQVGFGGGQMGFGTQGGFNLPANKYQNFANNEQAAANGKLSYQEFANRRLQDNNNKAAKPNQAEVQQAAQVGSIISDVDPKLIEAALASSELGNPSRFVVEEKIRLPRQQSAMIPLFDLPLESEQVSIYNPRVQAKHPLNGLRIKNPTKQSLMQGPISIVSDDQYVGESRIQDLQPGEQRFVSYAVDVGVEIKPYDTVSPSPTMTVSVNNNQLSVGYRLRSTRTYAIKNNTPEDRVIIIEQALRTGWQLVDEKSALETTRDLYRFKVPVKSGELVKYEVKEELPRIDPFAVTKHTNWNGFATTLGLDVWTTNERDPEEKFSVRVDNPNLIVVTHKDRRKVTYNIVNRSDVERTIDLEHFLPADRQIIGEMKPDPQNKLKFTTKLVLPALKKDVEPKPVTFTVVEENRDTIHEPFSLVGITQRGPVSAVPAPASVEDLPPARFITPLGIEVWHRTEVLPETLVSGKFSKGLFDASIHDRLKHVYTIRNTSASARTIMVEQIIPAGSSLAGTTQVAGQGGARKEYVVAVDAGKIQVQDSIVETKVKRSWTFEQLLAMPEETLKSYTKSDKLAKNVQEALEKGLGMLTASRTLEASLKEQAAAIKSITEEQKRVTEAFEKLPNSTPLYKRYLEKLEKLETSLEKSQSSVKEMEESQKKQKAEYEAYVKKLTAE